MRVEIARMIVKNIFYDFPRNYVHIFDYSVPCQVEINRLFAGTK